MFDICEAMYGDIMGGFGQKQQAQDMSEVTQYGRHFLALAVAHGFVIYSGLLQWHR